MSRPKVKPDRMAWFKFDVGAFVNDTMGLTSLHAGLYIRLMGIYWSSGNKLKDTPESLKRKLSVTSVADEEALDLVLNELFQQDADGNYRHEALDSQLDAVVEYSKTQSAKGAAGAAARASSQNQKRVSVSNSIADDEGDATDF